MTRKKHTVAVGHQECAREGCRKDVPKLARLHLDPFCSTVCFRAHHGLITDQQANQSHKLSKLGRESGGPDAWRRHTAVSFSQRGRR